MMKKDGLLEIGEIVRPHGVKGRIKARSFLVSKSSVGHLNEVFLRRPEEPAVPFRTRYLQAGPRAIFLEVEGIDDINAAARLVGCRILISPDRLEKLPDDEYYWHELLGLQVMTETAERLGTLASIIPGENHDVYVCSGPEREILLPAIGEVIQKIDLAAGVMVVRLLKGL